VPLALLLALTLSACTDLNSGQAGTVVDGHVVRVIETGERALPGVARGQLFQRLEIELDGSLFRGERVNVDWGGVRALNASGLLGEGDRVLLTVVRDGDARTYSIAEVVRLPSLAPFAVLLVVVLLAVARLKGLAALAGLAASIGVFLLAIVPALQRGDDPLIATVLGSIAVLGEMAELGEYAQEEHDRIGRLVVRLNISQLVVVGERARHIHAAAGLEGSWDGESVFVADPDEAYAFLRGELRPGDVVLVKSSKSAGLRFLGDRLAGVAS